MIGDRDDPHRFDAWENMSMTERSGQCIDLLDNVIWRLNEMQKRLVRHQRTQAQNAAMNLVGNIMVDLREARDDLLEDVTQRREQ